MYNAAGEGSDGLIDVALRRLQLWREPWGLTSIERNLVFLPITSAILLSKLGPILPLSNTAPVDAICTVEV